MTTVPFELAALAAARHYQRWIADSVTPFLGKRILEVGAGIGNLSQWLPVRERLFLTEPDADLRRELVASTAARFQNDDRITVAGLNVTEFQRDLFAREAFDTVVSFNVFEHIEDDGGVLNKLTNLLEETAHGKKVRIVTLVPAHQWAYGAMDRKYGHFRRYSKRSFASLAKRAAPRWRYFARYFNIVGLPGWVIMGKVLKKTEIHPRSIEIFEKICPYIRTPDDVLHRLLRIPLGQSLITVLELEPSS